MPALRSRPARLDRLVHVATTTAFDQFRDWLEYCQWLRRVLVCADAGYEVWPASRLMMRLRRERRYTRPGRMDRHV